MANVFITGPDSLVTTHEAYRASLLEIALFKNKESTPYLDKAKALYVTLKKNTTQCEDILAMPEIHEVVLESAGISQKTKKFLSEEDKSILLKKFIGEVIAKTGRKYVDEIVFRYLMAVGEQLGGHMRNCIGRLARAKLIRHVIAQLTVSGIGFKLFFDGDKAWRAESQYKPESAETIKAVSWISGSHVRTFLNNVTVSGLSKNVDIVLLEKDISVVKGADLKDALADTKNILMMGELKGGIDPAGGDEHWKTARGALERIRKAYKRVDILFICASIEKAMAKEIYSMLQIGDLNCVANLTDENQLSSACEWIIRL